MNDTIKVYDLKEVASILKINLRVLRRYIKEGKIKASKIGRKYVITAEDLDAYLQGNSKGTLFYNLKKQEQEKEPITEEDKALLEAMLVKADIGKEAIETSLETINKEAGLKLTEETLEAFLDGLLSLQATKSDNFRGIAITSKMNLLNGYKKTPTGYEIELNKDLVKQFKENMLLNIKIEKK